MFKCFGMFLVCVTQEKKFFDNVVNCHTPKVDTFFKLSQNLQFFLFLHDWHIFGKPQASTFRRTSINEKKSKKS